MVENFAAAKYKDISAGVLIKGDGTTAYIARPLSKKDWVQDGPFRVKDLEAISGDTSALRQNFLDRYSRKAAFYSLFSRNEAYNNGADPEIFAVDKDGKLLTADRWLPPAKPKWNGNTIVYRDGVAGEIAATPGTCIALFVDELQRGLYRLHRAIQRTSKGGHLTLTNVYAFTKKELAALPPAVAQLGCAPTLNAYGPPLRLPDGLKVPIRSAGGHIHMGVTGMTPARARGIVQGLDLTLGVASVSLAEGIDDPRRRQFYGQAGEYRLPRHGVEYRVLSNFWLCHPAIAHLVLELARSCYRHSTTGLAQFLSGDITEARRIINESDVAGARKYIKKHKPLFETIVGYSLPQAANRDRAQDKALEVLSRGICSVVKDPENITAHWALDTNDWEYHSGNENATWGSFLSR